MIFESHRDFRDGFSHLQWTKIKGIVTNIKDHYSAWGKAGATINLTSFIMGISDGADIKSDFHVCCNVRNKYNAHMNSSQSSNNFCSAIH